MFSEMSAAGCLPETRRRVKRKIPASAAGQAKEKSKEIYDLSNKIEQTQSGHEEARSGGFPHARILAHLLAEYEEPDEFCLFNGSEPKRQGPKDHQNQYDGPTANVPPDEGTALRYDNPQPRNHLNLEGTNTEDALTSIVAGLSSEGYFSSPEFGLQLTSVPTTWPLGIPNQSVSPRRGIIDEFLYIDHNLLTAQHANKLPRTSQGYQWDEEGWETEIHIKACRKTNKARRSVKQLPNFAGRSTVDSSTQTYHTKTHKSFSRVLHYPSNKLAFGEVKFRQISELLAYLIPTSNRIINMACQDDAPVLAESPVQWTPKYPRSTNLSSISMARWPENQIPVEIIQQIVQWVSRADMMNLRLVNREFEMKVSCFVFQSVVVPFRPQIYRNVATDDHSQASSTSSSKGKGKLPATQSNDEPYSISYSVKDLVYDGMKVFEAWGSHIRKFAMTFDINQDLFQKPPTKGIYENIQSFWGSYRWPKPHYLRYECCEDQEKRADDNKLMATALSNLSQVTELGLSVDDGLGWITGPDRSDRSKIFDKPATIFGSQHPHPESEISQRIQAWEALTLNIDFDIRLDQSLDKDKDEDEYVDDDEDDANITTEHHSRSLSGFIYADHVIPQRPTYSHKFPPLIFDGVDLERLSTPQASSHFKNALVVPNALKEAQKEWLLENYWAQLAFLTSWSLALVDNAATFRNVRTLTIAHLSSKHLETLQRQDIWTTLENLESLVLMLSPDWRDITQNDQGLAETPKIKPSEASRQFHRFLKTCIAKAQNITKLKIGYIGGGERAQGMFARNKNVLPAPVMLLAQKVGGSIAVLILPYVQHLTISNCWITPGALEDFVSNMATNRLENLVLDSVSLSAPLNATPSAVFNRPMIRDLAPHMLGLPAPPPAVGLAGIKKSKTGYRRFLFLRGAHTTICDHLSAPSTEPLDWLQNDPYPGSWPYVINRVTPAENLNYKRYLHGFVIEKPTRQPRSTLRHIQFISCGYVRLLKASVDQTNIGGTIISGVPVLRHRFLQLSTVMMSTSDPFLGTISPTIRHEEVRCLVSAFNMTLGWPEDDEEKYAFREDSQPIGGSGRFSGVVERFEEIKDMEEEEF